MKRKTYLTPGTKVHVNEAIGLSQQSYDAEVHYHGPGVYGFGTRVSLRHLEAQPNGRGEMTVWETQIGNVTVIA